MRHYDFSEKYQNVCVCGDIHGEIRGLVFRLKQSLIENSVIIVAGDCGIGFEKETFYMQLYYELERSLEKFNNLLLFVRGNHDDPAYFDGVRMNFMRMKCIPDYSVIYVAGHTILCIGGAVSIDRMQRLTVMTLERLRGKPIHPVYWEGESVVFDEDALRAVKAWSVDAVVTHTAPSFCNTAIKKPNLDCFLVEDEDLQRDLKTEKMMMDQIYHQLVADNHPLRNWYYGHFHQSQVEFINDIQFCLLNINEIKMI